MSTCSASTEECSARRSCFSSAGLRCSPWRSTGGSGRRCPLADQPEYQPPTPDHQVDLSDGDLGMKKESIARLAPTPRFERKAIIAAVLFQLMILVVMILGKTVPYVGARR